MFVLGVAIHAPIGLRTIVAEMRGGHGRGIDAAMLAFAAVLLALGLARGRRGDGGDDDASREHSIARATTGARAATPAGGRSPCIACRVSRSRLFLPAHFLVLGQALTGAAALDGVLAWTDRPLVKASEVALVFLLAVHLGGGLRLLLVEFGGWRASWQPALIAAAGGDRAVVRAAVRAESRVGRRCGSRRTGSRTPRRSSTFAR